MEEGACNAGSRRRIWERLNTAWRVTVAKLLRRVTDTHFNNFSWKLGKLIPCLLGAAVVNRVAVTRCYRLRRLGHLGATHEEGILGIS